MAGRVLLAPLRLRRRPASHAPFRLRAGIALAVLVTSTAGCALAGGTLGGREKCWPATPPRGASIWRGLLQVDGSGGGRLETPEGDVITLIPGTLTTRIGSGGTGELVAGDRVVGEVGHDRVQIVGVEGCGDRLQRPNPLVVLHRHLPLVSTVPWRVQAAHEGDRARRHATVIDPRRRQRGIDSTLHCKISPTACGSP